MRDFLEEVKSKIQPGRGVALTREGEREGEECSKKRKQ